MKQRPTKSVHELEIEWYARLKVEGFDDIEVTSVPDRPLKEYHSTKFKKPSGQRKRERFEKYYTQFEAFLNSSSINEICILMVKHGNNSMGPRKAKKVLQLHSGGLTERKIAKNLKCTKDSVHRMIRKAKVWMAVA